MPFTLSGFCEYREEIRKSRFITFAAPIKTLQPMVLAQKASLPGEYDSAFGDEPKGRQTSPYIRKPKYHYGWDWGPRILNVGLWRPVRLETWDNARIDTLRVDQDDLNDSEARLSAKAVIQADRETVANVRVTLTAPDGSQQQVVQQVTLAAGTNAVSVPITVANGRYSVNGAAFTAAPGLVGNGAAVRVEHIAAAGFTTTSDDLARAMRRNPNLKVLVASGRYAGLLEAYA